jgi:uncharacterized RDD family membrane protein YckC
MYKFDKYETFWKRLFALFIDGLILSLLNKLFKFMPETNSIILSTIISIIQSSLPYIYAILLVGKFGQTIGKMIMGVKIVDYSSESKATYYQAFAREMVPLFIVAATLIILMISISGEDLQNFKLSTFGLIILFLPSWMLLIWSILEIVTMLFNDKSRALHDIIADTVVVKIQKKE